MRRKLMVVLLIGVLLLVGAVPVLAQTISQTVYSTPKEYEAATGRKIGEFNEAPMLRVKVAAGELPPIEKRLPKEPLVVVPEEEIGQYGGTIVIGTHPRVRDAMRFTTAGKALTLWSPDGSQIIPNVVKGWELSEDSRSITFFLREGMKWSDGVPFTADDLVFWYEDILLNDSLTAVKAVAYKRAGKLGVMEKLDDYSVRFTFAEPYPLFITFLAVWGGPRGEQIYPKHYLKKFHPDYTPMTEIEKIMKREKFESWVNLFHHMADYNNPELPSIAGWIPLDREIAQIQRFVRNPFYWKVDTEGNQLPYVDEIHQPVIENPDAFLLKVMASELDFVPLYRAGSLSSYPMVMENREKGDYRLVLYTWPPNSESSIMFNFNHPDPVKRELYRDKRFRVALSVAISREEVNQIIYKGQSTVSQIAPMFGPPYHGESSLFKRYTEYDPEQANRLLDEIGLNKRDKEGYRLGLDGKELLLVIHSIIGHEEPETMELVKGYWNKVGLRIVIRPQGGTIWYPEHTAGKHDISCRTGFLGGGPMPLILNPNLFALTGWQYAPKWALWLDTQGAQGEEPPESVKRLREIREEIFAEPSREKRIALAMEAFQIHIDNLWSIGLYVDNPKFKLFMVSNRIRNVPPIIVGEFYHNIPSSWFIKE